jgi:metal-responsive CopG/Arc/MetJ family transcriptional regulator
MANVKTAVSIQESLFEQAEEMARRMQISRSHLYALALEAYIRREENRMLRAQIDTAYAEEPDMTEGAIRRQARHTHRRMVEDEW